MGEEQDLQEDPVIKLAAKQHLILSLIHQKLEIVNYIFNGWDTNQPILINTRFLHYTAHIFYRTIIIEIGALFLKKTETNKNNLHRYYKEEWVKQYLDEERIRNVEEWLKGVQSSISKIERLRHNEIAHFDFPDDKKPTVSFNFNNLMLLNQLFKVALNIVEYVCYGKTSFGFPPNEYLGQLQGMVKDIEFADENDISKFKNQYKEYLKKRNNQK